MQLDWETAARFVATLGPAIVALIGLTRGPGALRSRIKHDIEMLGNLPAESAAHTALLSFIEKQIDRLRRLETDSKRDITGAVISALLSICFAWLAIWLFGQDEWWWRAVSAASALFAAVGLGAMFEDLEKVPRDAKGKLVP